MLFKQKNLMLSKSDRSNLKENAIPVELFPFLQKGIYIEEYLK